jgi:hypothetical protein
MGKLLGDIVADFTKAIGVTKPCAGCKKRQEKLNELHRRAAGKARRVKR